MQNLAKQGKFIFRKLHRYEPNILKKSLRDSIIIIFQKLEAQGRKGNWINICKESSMRIYLNLPLNVLADQINVD